MLRAIKNWWIWLDLYKYFLLFVISSVLSSIFPYRPVVQLSECTRIAKNQHKTCTICAIFPYNCTQSIDGFSLSLQRLPRKVNDGKNLEQFLKRTCICPSCFVFFCLCYLTLQVLYKFTLTGLYCLEIYHTRDTVFVHCSTPRGDRVQIPN